MGGPGSIAIPLGWEVAGPLFALRRCSAYPPGVPFPLFTPPNIPPLRGVRERVVGNDQEVDHEQGASRNVTQSSRRLRCLAATWQTRS